MLTQLMFQVKLKEGLIMQIKNRFAIFLMLIGILSVSAIPAFAQTSYEWSGESGSWHTATNWTPNGVPGNGDLVSIFNGFVTLDGIAVTVAEFTLSGGTIYGQGTLTVTNDLVFTSGRMQGDSLVAGADTIIVAAGANLSIRGTGTKTIDNRVLVNNGSGAWENGNVRMTRNAVFQNDNSFNLEAGDRSITFQSPDGGIMKNNGTLTKTANLEKATINVEFHNNGTVNVETGELELKRSTISTKATFNTSAGNLTSFKSGPHTMDSVTVSGAGNADIIDSPVNINGGGLIVDTGSNFSVLGSGSSIDGDGDIMNNGNLDWNRAEIMGSGGFTNNGTLEIFGNNPKELGRSLTNNGQINWSESGTLRIRDGITITNEAGATFDIQNNALLFFMAPAGGTFENKGTITKSGGGTNFIDVPIVNNGTVDIQSDTLRFRTTLTNDTAGTIIGNGVLDLTHENAVFFNNGSVNPGASPGTLYIIGDFPMSSDASFSPELGGVLQSTDYDLLKVNGQAQLGGTLNISLINAYVPTIEDQFEVMKFDSRSGEFASVVFDAYLVTVTYTDSNVVLSNIELANQSPTATTDILGTNEDIALDVNVLSNDSDPEGDSLSIETFTQPSNGSVVQFGDSTLRYQPNTNFFGLDTFQYTINDGQGNSTTGEVQLTVSAVNDAPVISPALPDVSFQEDASDTLDLNGHGSDVDNDTTSLSWSAQVTDAQSPPPTKTGGKEVNVDTGDLTVTINPVTNKAAFTATADSGGVFTVVFTLSDPGSATDTDTITVTVNSEDDPPVVASPISDVSYNEDSGPNTVVADLGVIFSDPDPDDVLSYSTTSLNPIIQSSIQGTGLVVNSTLDSSGVGNVVVTANDGNSTVSDTFQVTIVAVNDAPVIAPPLNDVAFNEDDSTTLALSGSASDVDHATTDLTWSAIAIGANASNIQVTIDQATSVATIKSSADSNGVHQVIFILNDPLAALDTDTVTVTINPVNDAPVVAMQDVVFLEDSSTTISLNNFASDIDDDVAMLEWQAVVLSAGNGEETPGKNGGNFINLDVSDLQVSIDSLTNVATLTASPDSIGVFEVEFTATDTSGTSDVDTITVTVANASDPPVVSSPITDTAFPEDTGPNTAVQDLNTVFTDPDATVMTFSATSGNPNVLASTDGDSLTIATAPNFFGSSEIVVTALDASGESATDTFTVDITPVNDPPELTNLPDFLTVLEDDTLRVDLDTLATDVDDLPENLLWIGAFIDTAAANHIDVALDFETNVVTITPEPNFVTQNQQFTILVCDTSSACDTDTVTFSIIPVNDAPVLFGLPDTVAFHPDSASGDTVWNSVSDDLTPDSLLVYEFSVSNDSLLYSFDNKTGYVSLAVIPGFMGEATLGIKVTDEGGLFAEDSIVVVVDSIVVSIAEFPDNGLIPRQFAVAQNYPNPFNPSTAIKFDVPRASDVRVFIYNILGQRVRTLVSQRLAAGTYEATWDGLNDQGVRASSGVYIYRFEADNFTKVMKMIMMK